jgi:hypothetical protein
MFNNTIKFLIKEAVNKKDEENLINAAISYLTKSNDLKINPKILLYAKSILCDKRKGKNRNYGQINSDALKIAKTALDKVEEIKSLDPELYREMVKDGINRKYHVMVDIGNKIIIVGEF